MRSRSDADTNKGMVVDLYRYSSVTWFSYNKVKYPETHFGEELNTFFSDYVERVYELKSEVSNDPSSMGSRVFKTLFISRKNRRKPLVYWKR